MATAQAIRVLQVRGETARGQDDWIAVERPLEIRVAQKDGWRVLSLTMRTPGDDQALTAGFLFAEGVLAHPRDIVTFEAVEEDAVLVELSSRAQGALAQTQRSFVTTGACGVCGRTTLDSLLASAHVGGAVRASGRPCISADVIHRLPGVLSGAQATFAATGGLHAAGLFNHEGELLLAHEDVGRHNALDKLVGSLFLSGRLPAAETILMLSGRASFELVQKAAAAGIAVMAAVGAPSSLAVQVAEECGMTLLGFVRQNGFNVYSRAERLRDLAEPSTEDRHAKAS